MKLKENLRICQIGNQYIVVADRENVDMTRVISLNETAAYLWKHADGKDFTAKQLADALCEEYDVSQEKALADVEKTLLVWKANGLVEEDQENQ